MISVVAPIYNEYENLPELIRRLTLALGTTCDPWEIILVNDGSKDDSEQIIRDIHERDHRIKLVSLSRNFGHQPAVTAGIHHACGDCVVLVDGDLQDPPEIIPAMINRWREGYQVVLGERKSRKDTGFRGLGMRLFYPIFSRVTELPDATHAGIFGLMDRVVVDHFNKLPERNRFIPGLRGWLGFRRTTVEYDREERAAGKPKQTLGKLIHYAADAMISFSYKPLRAVTWLGFSISVIAFLLAMYYFVDFFLQHKPLTGFTTTIIIVLFLGGVQMISVGILGEYIGRIYDEIKQRPLYVVAETLGIESPQPLSKVEQALRNLAAKPDAREPTSPLSP